jgi:histone acetyltransferase 1
MASADQPPQKKQKIAIHEVDMEGSEFICKANNAMNINFLTSESGVDGNIVGVRPEFTHQFFGDEETIIGFKNLKVDILYSPSGSFSFFRTTFDDRLLAIGADPNADLPETKLNALYGIPTGYTKERGAFLEQLKGELQGNVTPPGKILQTYIAEKTGKTFEVFVSFPSECAAAKSHHERLETLALYTIDGASPVDLDDHRWRVYTVYERVPVGNGKFYRKFAAYLTAFKFTNPFREARNDSLRVCQILTYGSYQRQGHASKLLKQVSDDIEAEDMFELTMEDPSDVLTVMRNVGDVKSCVGSCFFLFEGSPRLAANSDSGASKLTYSWELTEDYTNNVQKKLRITKKQIRLCYEVLKLEAALASGNDVAKAQFKKEVTRRLYVLHRPSLDEIKNSEGKRDLAGVQFALSEIYKGQEAYFRDMLGML